MSEITLGEISPVRPRFKWTLADFTSQIIESKILSPHFSTNCLNLKYTWQLFLYPCGKRAKDKDYLSIFLYNRGEADFTASISFSVLNCKNEVVTNFQTRERVIVKNRGVGLHRFFDNSLILNDKKMTIYKDTLVIVCEIIFRDDYNFELDPSEEKALMRQAKKDALRLKEFDKQSQLMLGGKYSDVTFVIDGKKLELHKCILAKSSSVFAELFDENPEVISFEVNDVKYEVFAEVVFFVYVGKVQAINEIAGDLLAAADRYRLQELKLLCEMALSDQLCINSVVESLRLADVYGMERLKTAAIECIVASGREVVERDEFQLLPADVLCRICRHLMLEKDDHLYG